MTNWFAKHKFIGLIGALVISTSAVYAATEAQMRDKFEEKSLHLDELVLSNTDVISNSNLFRIRGSGAVEGAVIEIFANDFLIAQETDTDGGTFEYQVEILGEDGQYEISARQQISYKDETVNGSSTISFTATVDRQSPTGTIHLWSEPPEYTASNTMPISFSVTDVNEDASVLVSVNGVEQLIPVIEDNTHTISLLEGDNLITFRLQDTAGNRSESIKEVATRRDTIAPVIKSSLIFSCEQSSLTSEAVCLSTGSFEGPLYGWAYAPLTGKVLGGLSSLTVNGHYITIKPDGSVNQKVGVYVSPGDNNYDVVAVDKTGNTGYGIISVSWGSTDDEVDYSDDSECYCSSNSFNCDDFSSQYEAQDVYECCLDSIGYDVHDLDRDDDGEACESLP